MMVWLVEKKVVRHVLDSGFERIEIPVRVKFEFEVIEGDYIDESLSINILYNEKAIEKRYPKLNQPKIKESINITVRKALFDHLQKCGYVKDHR